MLGLPMVILKQKQMSRATLILAPHHENARSKCRNLLENIKCCCWFVLFSVFCLFLFCLFDCLFSYFCKTYLQTSCYHEYELSFSPYCNIVESSTYKTTLPHTVILQKRVFNTVNNRSISRVIGF